MSPPGSDAYSFISFAMKKLYMVRHAKSSWEHPGLSDFDRPLNDRGKQDAPKMGERLKERGIHLNLMLSSPARRAMSTCKRIADSIGYRRENIRTDRNLYHTGEDEILEIIRRLDNDVDAVMIFGHNPGMTDFVNALNRNQEPYIPNVPTCGIVAFQFNISDWNVVSFGTGEFLFFDSPKKDPGT